MILRQAEDEAEIEQARALFREYESEISFDLCFQGFEKELTGLPGDYAPPEGRLLLAWIEEKPAGCVALRNFGGGACEMKRLFLRPACRGQGRGRSLAIRIIEEARSIGYERMRLDTLPMMKAAVQLYRSLGFAPVSPSRSNPISGALYMELDLRLPRPTQSAPSIS